MDPKNTKCLEKGIPVCCAPWDLVCIKMQAGGSIDPKTGKYIPGPGYDPKYDPTKAGPAPKGWIPQKGGDDDDDGGDNDQSYSYDDNEEDGGGSGGRTPNKACCVDPRNTKCLDKGIPVWKSTI